MVFTVAICAAVMAGMFRLSPRDSTRDTGPILSPWPVLTTTATLVIGTISTLQLLRFPALRDHLQRDAPAVRSGEVWRLATAVTTQDGGWAGLASNLLTLVLIGTLAERLLGRRDWLVAFALPALAAEVVGLWWQPLGAGNSVAVAGLCGAVAATGLHRGPWLLPASICAVAFVALALTRDIHGAAGVTGLAVGLARRAVPGRRSSGSGATVGRPRDRDLPREGCPT